VVVDSCNYSLLQFALSSSLLNLQVTSKQGAHFEIQSFCS
jgi:hypothetical protein